MFYKTRSLLYFREGFFWVKLIDFTRSVDDLVRLKHTTKNEI